jgi:8-oxo-dGTP pyrophosphatase MutT (NUDIX family)
MFRSKRKSTPTTTNTTTTTGSNNRAVGMATPNTSRFYSHESTGSIPDSCFHTPDFLLGASMVIIQPSSGKVVLVNDTERHTWFLPRGRKDIGETLEQCALREAYEEVRFLVIVNVLLFKWGEVACYAPSARGCEGAREGCGCGITKRTHTHMHTLLFLSPSPLLPGNSDSRFVGGGACLSV